MTVGLANEHLINQIAELLYFWGIKGPTRKKVHSAKSKRTGKPFVSWQIDVSEKKHILSFCINIGLLGKTDKVDSALVATLKSAGSCNSYLPISHGEVLSHLVYNPINRKIDFAHNVIGGSNAFVPDAPTELLKVLKNWRKQSKDRISERRYEQLRPWLDDYFLPIIANDVCWEEVIAVEDAGKNQTYDLTVEKNHNFIANSFVTHNTELAKRKGVLKAISSQRYYPSHYIFAAPTHQQAKRIFWRDIKSLLHPDWIVGGNKKEISESELTIRLRTGAEIMVVGLDKPARIEGIPIDWICVDEYGNVKKEAWGEHIRPALSERGGEAWMIGVPEGRNHYYDMSLRAESAMMTQPDLWGHFSWSSADILPPGEIAIAKAELDELTFRQEYEANFLNFLGVAYYGFDRNLHAGWALEYQPNIPLVFAFDFNIAPGICSILQEQENETEDDRIAPEVTACIDEVWIKQGSNTILVCQKLINKYGTHKGDVYCYGDATGGAGGSAKVEGSDWDLVKKTLKPVFGDRIHFKVPSSNPPERVRVNAVNARILNMDGRARLIVDPNNCKHTIKDFEGVVCKEDGSGDIDKSADYELTHLTDAIGYYVSKKYPLYKHTLEIYH